MKQYLEKEKLKLLIVNPWVEIGKAHGLMEPENQEWEIRPIP